MQPAALDWWLVIACRARYSHLPEWITSFSAFLITFFAWIFQPTSSTFPFTFQIPPTRLPGIIICSPTRYNPPAEYTPPLPLTLFAPWARHSSFKELRGDRWHSRGGSHEVSGRGEGEHGEITIGWIWVRGYLGKEGGALGDYGKRVGLQECIGSRDNKELRITKERTVGRL